MLPIVGTDLTLKESFPIHAAMPSSIVRCWVGVYTTWKAAQILQHWPQFEEGVKAFLTTWHSVVVVVKM